VDDLGEAVVFALESASIDSVPDGLLNVGCGEDQSIRELAALVRSIVGFEGETMWDADKPDGTPQKRLDVSRLFALGWRPSIPLDEGLRSTYRWFLDNQTQARL